MDTKQFDTLLQLASLHVDASERERLQDDIGSILSYVDKLQGLKLDSVEFARTVVAAESYREDIIIPAAPAERKMVIENFPSTTSDNLLEAHAVIDRT
ncbi:hypothetical protein COV06_00215 [Candidatus Uhrbacteria bacterium CG10_big_fil_rev_8_21_14_0_10_50_16]|uniref:Asp-tRNA(Asn)/Glu-tRNA(Gln) amidotransferase GatCAB subunit C n=1 Tax=Candidatus Uhrbacteria bacterium CG10_big_fil_rev_8_21_14_0_10_50_16 TaxID=1975039 RepID=A0A2H0RN04_9BACT|nr:MAG: hypothetical protein COV06_00215 [Candidatus Uhrbacteria bacterium CG10_big_fil_rev_8_21_14_0_10_50_16]